MKGIVYCIRELSTGDVIYVGSTTQLLRCRKSAHKYNCYCSNPKLNSVPVYEYIRSKASKTEFYSKFIFETLICDNFKDIDELHIKENLYIKKLKPLCNCINSFSTEEEKKANSKKWREENKVRLKESLKASSQKYRNSPKYQEWRETNRSSIAAKDHEYYENHKEDILKRNKQYYEDNKQKHSDLMKEYYDEHREEILAKSKERYAANRDEILARRKAKRAAKKQCK